MTEPIDYAALIADRRITGAVPIMLAPGRVVRVVLRAIHEERMWELEQGWNLLPEDEQGRTSDQDVLREAFDHFETSDGGPLSLTADDYTRLVGRINRGERQKLLTEALRLYVEAPADPLSGPPLEPTPG